MCCLPNSVPNSEHTLNEDAASYMLKTERLLEAYEKYLLTKEDYEGIKAPQKAPPNQRDIREVLREHWELARKHDIYRINAMTYGEKCSILVDDIEDPWAHPELVARRQLVIQDWCMRSGAAMHACDRKEKFLTYSPGSGGIAAMMSNYALAYVAGIRTVLLRSTSGESVILKDGLHVHTINKYPIKLNEDVFGDGEAGHYADARKCEKIKSGQTGVNSVNDIDRHPFAYAFDFMDTSMSAGGQLVFQYWYMDSGATIHVCDSQAKFQKYTPGSGGLQVVAANNTQAAVAGIGTVVLRLSSGESVTLKDVLHVPTVNKCLISVSKLSGDGFKVEFEAQKFKMYKNDKVIGDGYNEGGMYRLNIKNDPRGASTSGTVVSEARQGSFSFLEKMFSYFK